MGREIVEIDEYVITHEIFNYISKFIEAYKNTFVTRNDEIGFWISGFLVVVNRIFLRFYITYLGKLIWIY